VGWYREAAICKKCVEAAKMKILIDFIRNETAATSIEYALIATGIAVAIVVAVTGLGTSMNVKYTAIKDALN
jgi:pilus assembly protein Flp/PilA